jgi:hypothetical protein
MLICLVLNLLVVTLWAQQTAKPKLAEALAQSRSPLMLEGGKLGGEGASVLSRAIVSSRFVLLGEEHFSKEVPKLGEAMCEIIHPDVYAVEVGPNAARYVSGLLKSSDRMTRMQQQARQYPSSMAFLDIQEENELAAHCAASSHNPGFELWGLDQEFVGSVGMLLDAMLTTHPGPQSRSAILKAQLQARKAESVARAAGQVELLFLLASTDAELKPLEQAIAADGNMATRSILNEFMDSRRIYQIHLQGLADSNRVRAEMLKRHFMADYTNFKHLSPQPRIFIKFGAMHTGKGFSFLHQRDLGNFIAEQADLEQTQSLHILALGARGVHFYPSGYGKATLPQPFDLMNDEQWSWLSPALQQQFSQEAGVSQNTMTLFDLRELRFRHLDLPSDWEHIVYSYDLLIIVPEFTAATPIR